MILYKSFSNSVFTTQLANIYNNKDRGVIKQCI